RDLGIIGVMSWSNNSLTADPSAESSTEPATAAPTVQQTSPEVTVPADDSTTNQPLIAVAVVVMLAIGLVARFLIRRRTVQ
ncbi:MAG: hypothetical protein NWR33_06480, partial [Ilumatobacteraceae bacterium]|nr:hypothetical protein [Ilumatobacteraceae bacterium]